MAATNNTNINRSKQHLPIGPSWSEVDDRHQYTLMNTTKQLRPTQTKKPSQDSKKETDKKMNKKDFKLMK
jgi:hypothetical protein